MKLLKLLKTYFKIILCKIFSIKCKKVYGWVRVYQTWQEALLNSTGYDTEVVINKVTNALLSVKIGNAVYERDSCLFDKIQYSFPLLASLLWIASKNKNKLSIIDFGGSLGSSYFQNIFFLEHLSELHWNIIEQEKFIDKGRQYFEDEKLKFYYTLNDCLVEQNCDTLLISGTLEYIKRPYELLSQLLAANFKYIIFDRTPFVEYNLDIVTLQVVPPHIYDASYPCWMFNEKKFMSYFKEYDLIIDFSSNFGKVKVCGFNAEHKGMLFVKKGYLS